LPGVGAGRHRKNDERKEMKTTSNVESINKAGLAKDQSRDNAFGRFRAASAGLAAERIETKYIDGRRQNNFQTPLATRGDLPWQKKQ
jgi:hypothetical protein